MLMSYAVMVMSLFVLATVLVDAMVNVPELPLESESALITRAFAEAAPVIEVAM